MKAKLEFDLDDPDDLENFNIYCKALRNHFIIWELRHNFWRRWKHEDAKDGQEVLDALNEFLNEELNEEI